MKPARNPKIVDNFFRETLNPIAYDSYVQKMFTTYCITNT
jgi:hypothetical protein